MAPLRSLLQIRLKLKLFVLYLLNVLMRFVLFFFSFHFLRFKNMSSDDSSGKKTVAAAEALISIANVAHQQSSSSINRSQSQSHSNVDASSTRVLRAKSSLKKQRAFLDDDSFSVTESPPPANLVQTRVNVSGALERHERAKAPPPSNALRTINANTFVDNSVRRKRAWVNQSTPPPSPASIPRSPTPVDSPPLARARRQRRPNLRFDSYFTSISSRPANHAVALTMQESSEQYDRFGANTNNRPHSTHSHRILLHCNSLPFEQLDDGESRRITSIAELTQLVGSHRRIYDVINVLEPLGVIERVSVGKYAWNGVERARQIVGELRAANSGGIRTRMNELPGVAANAFSRVLSLLTCSILSILVAAEVDGQTFTQGQLKRAISEMPITVVRHQRSETTTDVDDNDESEEDHSSDSESNAVERPVSSRTAMRRASDVVVVLTVIGIVQRDELRKHKQAAIIRLVQQ